MQPADDRPAPLSGNLRSLLFAPAVRADFIAKLPQRGADVVIIDLEDATPAHAKAEGRATTRALTPDLVAAGCRVVVRINSYSSDWFDDDVRDGLDPSVAAVMVPKVDTTITLDHVGAALAEAGLASTGVIVGIETALGVADARELLSHPQVVGAYFGAEDFVVDMGGVRTASNDEVAFARAAVALAGRIAGVPVFDLVTTDFRDDDRFTAEAAQARALGYAGKLCIHPAQVPLANAAFVPSHAEVERARRLLDAYDRAIARGIAAIDFEGQLVDEPMAVQARRIIALGDVDAG